MSDHNFEKQIQQKLDELKIPPADRVWSSVEAQIRKDKRRRRGLIFFPLFLLLIGGGGYFVFQNYLSSTTHSISKSTSTKTTPDHTAPDNNNPDNNPNAAQKTNPPQGREPAQPVADVTKQPDTKNAPGRETVGRNEFDNKTSQQVDPDKQNAGNVLKPRQQTIKVTKEKEPVLAKRNNNRTVTVGIKRPQKVVTNIPSGDVAGQNKNLPDEGTLVKEDVAKNQQINPDAEPRVDKVVDAVENNKADSAKDVVIVPTAPIDSAASLTTAGQKKAAGKKLKTTWKWGLAGSAGISNLNEGGFFDGIFDGILGVEKAMVADVSPVNNTQSNVGPTAVVYRPSEIRKGFSFSLGAFVQKNLTKRIAISTGLQYRFYSNHIQVGNRIDSFAMVQNAFGSQNINQYYRAAPIPTTHRYTNRFHFVELPVSGHLQLNKGNRLPISWNAGVSLSYLVSTNMLHFDSRTGLYYKDNDLLNRLQAGMSTGFAVTLLNASRVSIQLGPQLQYHFTDLMKQKVSDDKHLFYFGLNSRVFLKK